MKEEIKIAIFGLSLNVLDGIKQKIRLMYDDTVNITWANIADPHLDILLVNDMFFGSPTIQHLVGSQQVPYLRLINKSEVAGQIDGDKLFLPFSVSDATRKWFKDRYLKVPLSQKVEKQVAQITKTTDINKVTAEFFNERNGNLQIFDGHGNIGLMNARSEQVWLDTGRRFAGTDTTLNFTYATMQMAQSVSNIQGIDLRRWLWNILWYSPELIKNTSDKKFYKLKYWPHPDSKDDRKDVFTIAACFERGASIQQVAKKSGVSVKTIERFVSIALLNHLLTEIDAKDATLIIEEEKPAEGVLKGFFGKLRRKLGL